jgi:hypothetical protein
MKILLIKLLVHFQAKHLANITLPQYLKDNPSIHKRKAKRLLISTAKLALYGNILTTTIKKKL